MLPSFRECISVLDGTCIKAWAETSCKELYAYWIQDEVTFPEEEDKVLPAPLPEEEKKGSLGRLSPSRTTL